MKITAVQWFTGVHTVPIEVVFVKQA